MKKEKGFEHCLHKIYYLTTTKPKQEYKEGHFYRTGKSEYVFCCKCGQIFTREAFELKEIPKDCRIGERK